MARTKTTTKTKTRRLTPLERFAAIREAAIEQGAKARTRAVDAVSQLEKVFEQRVAGAMARLGVPTVREVRALSRQVAELQASVASLKRTRRA